MRLKCSEVLWSKNIENIKKHLLPQFVITMQSNLFIECIQNQFQFIKNCTSKHVGPIIVSYKGFYGILTLKTVLNTNIDGILSYCW